MITFYDAVMTPIEGKSLGFLRGINWVADYDGLPQCDIWVGLQDGSWRCLQSQIRLLIVYYIKSYYIVITIM